MEKSCLLLTIFGSIMSSMKYEDSNLRLGEPLPELKDGDVEDILAQAGFYVPGDKKVATEKDRKRVQLEHPKGLEISSEIIIGREAFLKETIEMWDSQSASEAKIKTKVRRPVDQNWSGLETDINRAKYGELTINPETQNINFETTKVFIPDLSDFEGEKLSKVAKYLVETYSKEYYLPGIEYMEWVVSQDNPESLPVSEKFETLKCELNGNNTCFLFGSLIRDWFGHWRVPAPEWIGDRWYRFAGQLDSYWNSNCRAVLLEKRQSKSI